MCIRNGLIASIGLGMGTGTRPSATEQKKSPNFQHIKVFCDESKRISICCTLFNTVSRKSFFYSSSSSSSFRLLFECIFFCSFFLCETCEWLCFPIQLPLQPPPSVTGIIQDRYCKRLLNSFVMHENQ